MSYEEFKWALLDQVKGCIEDNVTVRLHQVPKNNGNLLDGISIVSGDKRFSPVMYIAPYYQKYLSGEDMEELARELVCRSREAMEDVSLSFEGRPALSEIRQAIYVKVVNHHLNASFLEKLPSVAVLDLTLIFYYQVELGGRKDATILIKNEDMAQWQLSVDDLLRLAMNNTVKDKPYTFTSLSDIMSAQPEFEEEAVTQSPLYVLTNHEKLYGAVAVFYPDILKDIARQLGDDLFILPSSVHEVIVLPAKMAPEKAFLRELVHEVNQNEVAEDEVLSDNIYYFSREDGELRIC